MLVGISKREDYEIGKPKQINYDKLLDFGIRIFATK